MEEIYTVKWQALSNTDPEELKAFLPQAEKRDFRAARFMSSSPGTGQQVTVPCNLNGFITEYGQMGEGVNYER